MIGISLLGLAVPWPGDVSTTLGEAVTESEAN